MKNDDVETTKVVFSLLSTCFSALRRRFFIASDVVCRHFLRHFRHRRFLRRFRRRRFSSLSASLFVVFDVVNFFASFNVVVFSVAFDVIFRLFRRRRF